ncbi:putative metal-dependent hydrolase YcfH [Spirochaetia bacterium]|nr:putative metal-dependent hydrolase YcfH [Spirochaetia bacterium]
MSHDIHCGLTDTHAHLSYLSVFNADCAHAGNDQVDLQAANSTLAEFDTIIDIGTDADDLGERLNLLCGYKNVLFSAGIWPRIEAINDRFNQIDILRKSIEAHAEWVSAIGECGFDRRENPLSSTGEDELFEMQLELARQYKKPIIVHTREAANDAQQMLAKFKDVQAIIHCYSYDLSDAKKFLNLGAYISFAGNLTFKNAHNLREAIRYIPHWRLLLETDCPYLAPVPFRGKQAHPGMILETYKMAAELMGIDIDALKHIISENTKKLFCPHHAP